MRDKLMYEGWSEHPALPPGWLARVAEQAPGSGRRWGVFLSAEGVVLPGRLALRLAGPEGESKGFWALCALGFGLERFMICRYDLGRIPTSVAILAQKFFC